MRILITGGFGFIGSRLAVSLAKFGHQIILGTRNFKEPPEWLPTAEVNRMDWIDHTSLWRACNDIDVVIHAAGMNAKNCSENPLDALAFNGLGTARLVDVACDAGVKRFIYLSTAHVYADPLVGSIHEKSCPTNIHPYSTSHLAGENAVKLAGQNQRIETIVVRMSNAVGAPVHKDVDCWSLLVNDLCRQAICQNSIKIRSAGLQQRNFISMLDVERAFFHLINLDLAKIGDGLFNLGGNESLRVIDIAKMIQSRSIVFTGNKPQILCGESSDSCKKTNLKFGTTKLHSTGFELMFDLVSEIDSTLQFCLASFGEK